MQLQAVNVSNLLCIKLLYQLAWIKRKSTFKSFHRLFPKFDWIGSHMSGISLVFFKNLKYIATGVRAGTVHFHKTESVGIFLLNCSFK